MKVRMKLEGAEKVSSALRRLGERAPEELGRALYAEAELIMTASKEQCPVDTGNLRSTGHVEPPDVTRFGATVRMGYGGTAAPYAVYVHERLDLQHTVGKAKFLEDPVKAAAPKLPGNLARRLSRALEGGSNAT